MAMNSSFFSLSTVVTVSLAGIVWATPERPRQAIPGSQRPADEQRSSEDLLSLPTGVPFVIEISTDTQSAQGDTSPAQIAQNFIADKRMALAIDPWQILEGQVRSSRYGHWVAMHLSLGGQVILRRQLLLHVNKSGQIDRISGHLPASSQVTGRWQLDAQDALLATNRNGAFWSLVDASTARDPGTVARALWDDVTRLIPVFVVYPHSLDPGLRLEVIIDANDGHLIGWRNRVLFADPSPQACANVFTPSPGTSLNAADLHESLLPLASPDAQGYLSGPYFKPYNCCRQLGCDPQAAESRLQGSMANPIGIGADPLYYDIVMCDEHPKLQSVDGDFRRQPSDPAPDSPDYDQALEDDFAEGAVYFAAQNHFDYMRQIGDPNFLLRAHGGQPDAPAHPFHLTVNFLLPDLAQAYEQAAPWPLGQGRGDVNNPVIIDDFMRMDNAAYMPAQVPGDPSLPIDILTRDFDSVVFFQGVQRDFAYDGDIVYHELTHAVVGSTSNLINATMDSQGALSAPGALNEGFADYFAASLSGDSLTGEYGGSTASNEGGIRDADNNRSCPQDLTGEVHDDSWPWSGALWDQRDVFVGADCDRERFDAAIYDAMVGLPQDADFSVASEAVTLALAGAYGRDSGATQIARCIFARRGMSSCERVLPLLSVDAADGQTRATPVSLLILHGSAELALDQAPGQMQLRVDAPQGSHSLTLAWDEGSGGLNSMLGGGSNFDLLVKRGAPIVFSRSASGTLQHDADARLTVTRQSSGFGQPAIPDPLVYTVDEACGASYFFAFVNAGGSTSVSAIQASAQHDDALAETCSGPSEILPAPEVTDSLSCAALPSQDRDSETCQLDPPHLPKPCGLDDDATPEASPEPSEAQGCQCNAQYGSGAAWPLWLSLLGLAAARRRRAR